MVLMVLNGYISVLVLYFFSIFLRDRRGVVASYRDELSLCLSLVASETCFISFFIAIFAFPSVLSVCTQTYGWRLWFSPRGWCEACWGLRWLGLQSVEKALRSCWLGNKWGGGRERGSALWLSQCWQTLSLYPGTHSNIMTCLWIEDQD